MGWHFSHRLLSWLVLLSHTATHFLPRYFAVKTRSIDASQYNPYVTNLTPAGSDKPSRMVGTGEYRLNLRGEEEEDEEVTGGKGGKKKKVRKLKAIKAKALTTEVGLYKLNSAVEPIACTRLVFEALNLSSIFPVSKICFLHVEHSWTHSLQPPCFKP
jgi:hypothetical protein